MTTTKLEELIKSKKFDYVNPDITSKLFPAPKSVGTDFKLFHFNRYISSEDAIKEMEKEGYRAANVYELPSWDGWNDKDLVVALGSVGKVDGSRRVPDLDRHASKRGLDLHWWDGDWGAGYRFLGTAVTSVPSTLGNSVTLGRSDTLNLVLGKLNAIETVLSEIKKQLS